MNGEHVVNDKKDELSITDQETQTDPVVLELQCQFAEVSSTGLLVNEHLARGTLHLEHHSGLGDVEFIDGQLSEVFVAQVRQDFHVGWLRFLLGGHSHAPAGFDHQVDLVDAVAN